MFSPHFGTTCRALASTSADQPNTLFQLPKRWRSLKKPFQLAQIALLVLILRESYLFLSVLQYASSPTMSAWQAKAPLLYSLLSSQIEQYDAMGSRNRIIFGMLTCQRWKSPTASMTGIPLPNNATSISRCCCGSICTDIDFLGTIPRDEPNSTAAEKYTNNLKIQVRFYRACTIHMHEQNRTWTSYHDIDEY